MCETLWDILLLPHFFLPPEIFALIASASALFFFICSFWAIEPSSSSSSSSFLLLAAASGKLGENICSGNGGTRVPSQGESLPQRCCRRHL